jgi:endonuclease/exonuclease/phosphatase (EEP) superfamily protein YafD
VYASGVLVARRLTPWADFALALCWAVGQFVRDATWLTGLCFYIPSIVVAALLAGSAALHARSRSQWRAGVAAALAALALGVSLGVENAPVWRRPRVAPAGAMRLVHWNVGWRMYRQRVRDVLLEDRADFYVLSELGRGSVDAFHEALGPGYQARAFANLAVVGRGEVDDGGWLLHRGGASVRRVDWRHEGRQVAVFVVDLPSSPRIARAPLLEEILRLIARDRPDLVVGDFNAPRRSLALQRLPAGYQHAYESAGSGWGDTWPLPVPVYSLDHCVHSDRLTPSRYALMSSWQSDHRRQVFEFLPWSAP